MEINYNIKTKLVIIAKGQFIHYGSFKSVAYCATSRSTRGSKRGAFLVP